MSATTFLRRRNYAGDTCKNEEFPVATFGKAFCIFRYLGVAKNTIGLILLGEAIPWETDPPEMRREPFYRLMGFVVDRQHRGRGIGGEILEKTIQIVYRDFGRRPIALGCHKDNTRAERFYLRHGFKKTNAMEENDYYYLRSAD